jgi:hypothetical protein
MRSLTPFIMSTPQSFTMNSQVKRNLKNKKEKSTQGIKCHEYLEFGHIRIDCANYLKPNREVMKYNLNDELDIDDSPIDNINYFAFAASYESS